jgi:micrococcal nuclease
MVKRISLTSPVRAGDEAALTVNVAPRARCTIEVIYDTVVSKAKGLNPKRGGQITWRWRVGTSTHPGRWPIIVRCGQSGTLRMKIRVLPG